MSVTAIDLFAGCGGFTTAAQQAGVRVAWAANHWPLAVQVHERNHPQTTHACQDLQQADWTRVPAHDLLLASPACQGHSRARGAERPHHDAQRSTAWSVVSCAEVHRPLDIVVENVPEFTHWILYPQWSQALKVLGYSVQRELVDAADYGVPQNRNRIFIVATRRPGGWRVDRLRQQRRAAVPAREIIDWSHPPTTPVARLCARTRERVAAGHRASGGNPFLVSYYGNSLGGRSLDRPIGTITTRDRWGLVVGDCMRMLTVEECRRAMDFPAGYALPDNKRQAVHLLGNAVCPPAAAAVIRSVIS